jgi:hypothetical protein
MLGQEYHIAAAVIVGRICTIKKRLIVVIQVVFVVEQLVIQLIVYIVIGILVREI